jgi:hypothetical protein
MRVSRLVREVGHGRWQSAALAVALVLAQGASLAHFALVKHAICPLHGELIHPDSEPHAAPVVSAANRAEPALFGSEQDGDASRDDHCGVVGHRREVALTAVTTAVLADAAPAANAPVGLAWAPTSETRFRVAPKQSPPA